MEAQTTVGVPSSNLGLEFPRGIFKVCIWNVNNVNNSSRGQFKASIYQTSLFEPQRIRTIAMDKNTTTSHMEGSGDSKHEGQW